MQSWKIDGLKIYKMSSEVIKFIEKTIENWRVELIAGGKSLTKLKIQGRIFQGDALSRLLFVLPLMLLKYILRKCIGRYKFH